MKFVTEEKFIETMEHLHNVMEIDSQFMGHILKRSGEIEGKLDEIM